MHYSHNYTWAGDNVSSTVRYITDNNTGECDTIGYSYEYTAIDNPFNGFPFWQTPLQGIIWGFEGIDGLCKNMPLHIVEDAGDSTFEYVTVSGRVSTVTINQTAQSDTDLVALRVTTKYYYEIEYAN